MNRHHLAIIGTAVLYGLIPVFVRLIGDKVPMMTMSFFRLLFGLLFVTCLAPFLGKERLRPRPGDLKHFAAVGVIMAATLTLYNIAFLYTSIASVSLLVNSYVIVTAALAWLLLKERLSRKEILIMLCGLIGIVYMSPFEAGDMLGNLLAIAAGMTYAALLLYMRWEERSHTIGTVFWFLLFASLAMLPFPFIYGWGDVMGSLLWLALLGILPTGLGYLLLAYGLEKTDAPTASILILLATPLASILFGWLVFEEAVGMAVLYGGIILLFAGVLLENEKLCGKKAKHQ
jgi:drug/metabolite transporter (DMT)-like permease